MPIPIPCFTCFGDRDPVREGIAGGLQDKVGQLFAQIWDWTLGWPTDLLLLPRNAELLHTEMEELKEMREDTERKVLCGEAQPSMERKSLVEGWLARVRVLETQVSDFQAALQRQSNFIIIITGLSLGRAASEKLKRVRELKAQLDKVSAVVDTAAPDASTLEEEMAELRVLRDDLMRKVENKEAADPQMERTPPVKAWLGTFAAVQGEVAKLLPSGGCQSPQYSEEVTEKLRRVRKLRSEWKFDGEEVVTRVLPPGVEVVSGKPVSSIVGGEETLSKLTGYLSDPRVAIIGVWGMAGIGKTTLLKQINNRLCAAGVHADGKFDVVVWVTVKKDRNILAIQKAIGKRIGLALAEDDSRGADEEELAVALHKSLSKKKFLLFLDDVWERLDLEEQVGIPYPSSDNGCKILFTTRSEYVCIDMGAQKRVKVSLLHGDQSWELFRRSASDNPALRNPSIRRIATKVVAQCGGLPLALLTVGRAMANKEHLLEWRKAEKDLQDNAKELRRFEKDVLTPLKFSFDQLASDTLRSCLLYCSLFPEDHEIDRQQLVEYWIGEDFIDGRDVRGKVDMGRARGRGLVLISDLQAASLLDSGIDDVDRVKLHDAVRDMAQWLTSGSVPGYTDVFMVHAGQGREAPLPSTGRWVDAKRISFMNSIELILPNNVPDCPKTTTWLAKTGPNTAGVCDALLMALPMLCVLDMSDTSIDQLPASIGSLVHLRYLNISFTTIVSLPKELGNLRNLHQLSMRNTHHLQRIPVEAFSQLTSLWSLDMYMCGYSWSWEHSSTEGAGGSAGEQQQPGVCLKDLESMEDLSELGLKITTMACLQGLLHSGRFTRPMKSLQTLQLQYCKQLEELQFGGDQTESLESLELRYLPVTRVVVANALLCLQQLELTQCHRLRHITWAGRLPCLKSVSVISCDNMEELLVAGEDATGSTVEDDVYFPMLRTMDLRTLPLLRSIAPPLLLLPSLESILVYHCPRLKKLPLGAGSAARMRLIKGEQEWWDGLEWEDQTIKNQLIPHLVVSSLTLEAENFWIAFLSGRTPNLY